MTRVYVAGPIAGHADHETAFRAAAARLRAEGFDVVVPLDVEPADHPGECPRSYAVGANHSAACYLRSGLAAMLGCDAILLLPGWESSVGTRLELSVAAAVGMTVMVSQPAGGVS